MQQQAAATAAGATASVYYSGTLRSCATITIDANEIASFRCTTYCTASRNRGCALASGFHMSTEEITAERSHTSFG